jgi:hypothetical protein
MRKRMNRADRSEATYAEAIALAQANGLTLLCTSDGCYQLRHPARGWIINMYPRRNGLSPRMYHDPHHRGPFLQLPENWTLLDAVHAAVLASAATPPRPATCDGQ